MTLPGDEIVWTETETFMDFISDISPFFLSWWRCRCNAHIISIFDSYLHLHVSPANNFSNSLRIHQHETKFATTEIQFGQRCGSRSTNLSVTTVRLYHSLQSPASPGPQFAPGERFQWFQQGRLWKFRRCSALILILLSLYGSHFFPGLTLVVTPLSMDRFLSIHDFTNPRDNPEYPGFAYLRRRGSWVSVATTFVVYLAALAVSELLPSLSWWFLSVRRSPNCWTPPSSPAIERWPQGSLMCTLGGWPYTKWARPQQTTVNLTHLERLKRKAGKQNTILSVNQVKES